MRDDSSFVRAHTPHTPQRVRERTAGLSDCACENEQWIITLEAMNVTGDTVRVPMAMRIKQLLKIAGRGMKMRCVSVARADNRSGSSAESGRQEMPHRKVASPHIL